MKRLAYNMHKSHGGSERFGPCECCGKNVDATYHLVGERVYVKPDGKESLTHHGGISKFGHYDCLAKLTEAA